MKTGDNVVVIAGKDKGKTGTVLRVLQSTNRVVVAGVNMRKKHMRRTPQQAGQIISYEASIHASNVMALDPKTKKRTRIGVQKDEKKGTKLRIAKKSGEELKKVAVSAGKKEESTKDAKKSKKKEKAPAKGTPFWKRLGADALDETEKAEEKEDKKDKKDSTASDSKSE